MTAPTNADIRPALRENIAEWLWRIKVHSEIVERYLHPGADANAAYAFRQMLIYVRLAESSIAALSNVNNSMLQNKATAA